MNKLLLILLFVSTSIFGQSFGPQTFSATPLSKGTLFTSPTGTGSTCSVKSPCSIWTVVGKAVPGSVIFLRGGNYNINKTINFYTVGKESLPVIYESYPGEYAILNGDANPKGASININVSGSFIKLRNFEVKNMPMQGFWIKGNSNTLDTLYVHHNSLSGIQVYSPYDEYPYGKYGSRNTIKNSVITNNFDKGKTIPGFSNGGNADGVSISSGANNVVKNNIVNNNSDDGIDAWRSTDTYIGFNIVFKNGIEDGNGNGIKAGGAVPSRNTLVEHNLVYSNRATGINYNTGSNVQIVSNNTWNNGQGYYRGSDTLLENNISAEPLRKGVGIEINNSWQRPGSVVFISTTYPNNNFLKPTLTSGFRDIGAYVKGDGTEY